MWTDPNLLKIMVAVPEDKNDSAQHVVRYIVPFSNLYKRGLIDKPIIGSFSDLANHPESHAIVRKADIIYNRAAGNGMMNRYCMEARSQGKRVLVDLDDDFWHVDPLNPSYKLMGTEEVWAEKRETGEKVKVWEDKRDDFDVARNRRHIDMVAFAMAQADLVTCTQWRLAERLKEFNPNVVCIPNPVDLDVWHRAMPRDGFRIGWAGGDSHAHDVKIIIPALLEFLKRHDDAKVILAGALLPPLKRLPEDRYEYLEWVGMEAWPYFEQWLGLHVGLAPLVNNRFNECKSVLKWEEYSAMCVPTIASDAPPYSDEITSGTDGILVSDDGWLEALERIYAHKEEAKALAENARKTIKRKFSAEVVADQWLDTLIHLKETPTLRLEETAGVTPILGGLARFQS